MHAWALSQGMIDESHAKLITDAHGARVTPDMIYDAIKAILDGPGVDQLFVYFAGHGVNINRSEQWLLSDAPVRTNAAVNVAGSVELARYCGVRHVVFISDACRVAPEGIQAQNVRGSDVFPNDPASDRAKPVDQFFACVLGRTAAEIKVPSVAAGNFSALYTNVLLDALNGARDEVLELDGGAGSAALVVRPRRLEEYLEREVPARVRALNLLGKVNQDPDAIITSDAAWLARVSDAASGARRSRGQGDGRPSGGRGGGPSDEVLTLTTVAHELVRTATTHAAGFLHASGALSDAARAVPGAESLASTAKRVATPFGPDHFETECGIKVRGARIVEFVAPRARCELAGPSGELLRIHAVEGSAASVLLQFEGGVGTVIPALPGFIAGLTFDDGELVDLAYEPSANSWRWQPFEQRAADVRWLRGIAASASRDGRFRLGGEDATGVAQRMQYAKGIDPTLAVYAAHAYHELQEIDRVRRMSDYLRDDLGVTFFDLSLLSRTLIGKSIGPDDGIVPFMPLLSQGWPLLRANRVRLHPALEGVEGTLRESLWSLYDPAGVDQIRNALHSKEVR